MASFGLAALFLAGCAGGTLLNGSSWPGISATDDAIFVSYQRQVIAVDPETRAELWRFDSESSRRGPLGGRRDSNFYAEPAVRDSLVVVGDYDQTVYAIDVETGQQRWAFDNFNSARFIGGATIDDGIVYIGDASGTLYALDADDVDGDGIGNLLWPFEANEGIWDKPLVSDGVLYVSSLDHFIYKLDSKTGNQIWSLNVGAAVVSTPTLVDGVLYFGAFDKTIHAIDAESKSELWSIKINDWVWDSPAVSEDILVVGDLSGKVYAVDIQSGTLAWEFQTDGPILGTPAIVDDIVYVGSEDTKIYALELETGIQLWEQTIQAEITTAFLVIPTGTAQQGVPVRGTPVHVSDNLIIGIDLGRQSSDLLQSLNLDNRDIDWAFTVEGLEGQTSSSSATTSTTDAETEANEADTVEEPLSFGEQIFRLLPFMVSMGLLTFLLFRRKSPK